MNQKDDCQASTAQTVVSFALILLLLVLATLGAFLLVLAAATRSGRIPG